MSLPKRIRINNDVHRANLYAKSTGLVFTVIDEDDTWPETWVIELDGRRTHVQKTDAEIVEDEPGTIRHIPKEEALPEGVTFEAFVQKHSQYKKPIRGVTVDVYDILSAFEVHNPATAHAVKKLLRAGTDHNDRITDLREAIDSLHRAVELEEGK